MIIKTLDPAQLMPVSVNNGIKYIWALFFAKKLHHVIALYFSIHAQVYLIFDSENSMNCYYVYFVVLQRCTSFAVSAIQVLKDRSDNHY